MTAFLCPILNFIQLTNLNFTTETVALFHFVECISDWFIKGKYDSPRQLKK